MSLLHLDAALGGRALPQAPLTSSRYPAKPGQKKQFTFQQQQKQRQSLAHIALAHNATFSPALSPTQQPSTPSSAALNAQPVSLPPHITAPPLTFLATAAATSLTTTQPLLPSTTHPTTTASSGSSSSSSKSSRIPAFQLEKFLTSNQHLSTAAERLAASLILKKDSRKRSSADMQQVAKFLQTIDAFRGLSLAVCVDLAAACRIRKFNREEIVYREGDDAVNFYVIMRGSVGTRINPQLSHMAAVGAGAGMGGDEKEGSEGYIAGIEYAGSSLGSDSFSSSLLPRHSSTRMALERSELLVLNVSDYTAIMRLHQREEEKQRMHLLKHIKCFELCTADELWQIAQHMQPVQLAKNAIVFTQGETAATLYFIESGECRAIYTTPDSARRSMYLDCGRMRQYSFFGELGLWQDGRDGRGVRTCSVYCETSCVLYAMSYDSFRARVPKFVVASMREWGDVLYGKEGNGELAAAVRAEQRWKAWKDNILKELRPAEKLRQEANKSGKWEGRTQMRFA